MKLTRSMEQFVLHWGEMGSRWGMNRSVAQIHALLYLSPEPLPAEAIAETLGIARSNVSTSLKELQSWDLVTVAHVLGDRRDHFQARKDIWEIITTVVDGRKRRELDPTAAFLNECVRGFENDKETPKEVKERISGLLEFTEELGGWYEQIRRMPKGVVVKLMRMGARVAKAVGA